MDVTPRSRDRTPRWLVLLGVGLLAVLVAVGFQTPPPDRDTSGDAPRVAVIAHGGAQGHAPGNTIEAFDLALEMGADTLEMDLQLSADDELVVMHDATVDRTTDGAGAVRDLTLEQLQELDGGWSFEDADGGHPWRGRDVRIPTFEQVLERYPDTPMVVELKTDAGPAIIDPAMEALADRGRDDGSVVLASFSRDYLDPVREQLPQVPTNMPEGETTAFYIRHLVGLHPWWTPPGEVFQVPEYHEGRHVVTPRFVDAAERLGIEVQVWTVNEPEQMERLLDAGVHGIMTDYPDRLVEVLGSRSASSAGPDGYGPQLQRARDLQEGPGWLLGLLHAITFLGDEEFYLLAFPVLYWAISRRIGIRLGAMLLLTAGVNSVAKLLVASPRPPFFDASLERVPEATFGIPSGHSQNAVAVWGLLAVIVRRWWAVVGAAALTLAIGWSRIHLGAHFLEDVLVGWGTGAVLLVLYLWLEPRVAAWWSGLSATAQVLAGVVASLALIVPGVVLSARLQGQRFWPGMVHVEEVTGASAVVTPAATLAGLVAGLVLLRARGGFDSGGSPRSRLLRLLVGLAGVAVLWQGLGAVFPGGEDALSLLLRYLRYALVGAWVAGIAPLLFVRLGLAAPAPTPERETAMARER